MIEVTIYRDSKQFVSKFTVSGHSGYSSAGSDIICAAISALAQTAIGSLEELTKAKINYLIEDENGYLECEVENVTDVNDKIIVETIIKTLEIGCRQIIDSYGKKYVKLSIHQM